MYCSHPACREITSTFLDPMIRCRIHITQHCQTDPGTQMASYRETSADSFLRDHTACTWSWRFISTECSDKECVKLGLHQPVYLHSVTLEYRNNLKCWIWYHAYSINIPFNIISSSENLIFILLWTPPLRSCVTHCD